MKSNEVFLNTAKASTTFIGTEKDVIEYVNELSNLTSCAFNYEKIDNDSWIIFGDITQESIDKYCLHSDFVIDVPSNLEVYNNGEVHSVQFSRKIHSLSLYHHIIKYRGRLYELEVSGDEISQDVENPNDPARIATL